MILEKFVMQWLADTKQATADIDKLDKKAEDVEKRRRTMTKELVKNLKEYASEGYDYARGMNREMGMAANAADRIAKGFKSGGVGAAVTAVALPAIITGAVFAISRSIANKYADENRQAPQAAWNAGLSDSARARAQTMGSFLGVSAADVDASRASMFERAKTAAVNPYTIEALRYRQAGISVRSGGGMRNMEDITKDIIKALRSDKFKNESEKIAWATLHMGMSFSEASKYARATDEEMARYNANLDKSAAILMASNAASQEYIKSQNEVETKFKMVGNTMNVAVAPAMSRFYKMIEDNSDNIDNITVKISKVFTAIVDGITDLGNKVLGWFGSKSEMEQEYESKTNEELSKIIENERKKLQDNHLAEYGATSQELLTAERVKREREAAAKVKADLAAPYAKEKEQINNAPGLNDAQRTDMLNALKSTYDVIVKMGGSSDQLVGLAQRLLDEQVKGNQIAHAQAEFSRPPIPVQPVTVGLEQALSLWASGAGKAAGLAGPAGAAPANTRADYEKLGKQALYLGRDPAYNPNQLASQRKDIAEAFKSAGIKQSVDINNNVTVILQGSNISTRAAAAQVADVTVGKLGSLIPQSAGVAGR